MCLCQVELTCVFVPGGVDGEQYLRVHPPRRPRRDDGTTQPSPRLPHPHSTRYTVYMHIAQGVLVFAEAGKAISRSALGKRVYFGVQLMLFRKPQRRCS